MTSNVQIIIITSIWLIDGILTGTITLGHCRPGNNSNGEGLHTS